MKRLLHNTWVIHTLLFLIIAKISSGDLDPDDQLDIILNKTYDKHQRPKNATCLAQQIPNDTCPLTVDINLQILSFSSISVVDMDYTINALLRQRWVDDRLAIRNGNFSNLSLSYIKEKIWIPDLFFRNAKQGQVHTLTTPNYLMWLQSNGTIIFSQKITVKLACYMRLQPFPLDTQKCYIEMGSYGYLMSDVEFKWWGDKDDEHMNFSNSIYMNEFYRPTHTTMVCNKKYSTTGQFTCLKAEINLKRKFGFYLIYTYLPSMLIIAISWLSFMIDHTSAPARISIGLLSVLSIMTQSSATLQKLPPVSYVKAIDVWLFICLAFVVISLLEFAIVNSLSRFTASTTNEPALIREKMRSVIKRELLSTTTNLDETKQGIDTEYMQSESELFANKPALHEIHGETATVLNGDKCADEQGAAYKKLILQTRLKLSGKVRARRVDKFCVYAFPVAFLIFNILYWPFYSKYYELFHDLK